MTGFSNVIGGVKHWLEHIFETATVKEILTVGVDVGKQVVVNAAMAGMAAHATGSDKAATEAAIRNSALGTLATVGIPAGEGEVEKLVSHISDSIHTPEAPLPPA